MPECQVKNPLPGGTIVRNGGQLISEYTISQIAEGRKLGITTIEGHLAYYVSIGEIPVSRFVSQEMTELIAPHFDEVII